MKSTDNSLTEAQKKAFDAYNRNDHKAALRLLTPLAEQGDIPAQLALVNIYRRGVWGCSVDLSRASYWLEQVTAKAENGCVEAQWALHEFHYWSSELPFGWHNAASDHWLAAAANSGLPEAQIELSLRYRLGGFGMKKSLKKAEYWLDQAVAQQDPEALLDKAFTYFENGRPTDKAKILLKAAVARGSVRATEYLDRD